MVEIKSEDVARVDKSDMMGVSFDTPAQVERALRDVKVPDLSSYRGRFNKVFLTGLGGSAIGADYLAHWAQTSAKVPLTVGRDYRVPSWVDRETLVVAISFSGGTEETLAAFVDARAKGALLLGISTGGKLQDFCAKTKTPYIGVEGGTQPRASLGRMLVAEALALEAVGAIEARGDLQKCVATLRTLQGELDPKAPPERNEAKRIALALKGQTPFVYAPDYLAPVARRFANQLNENSKVLAGWGVMPEMNHNELVGWSGQDGLERFTAVFLRHKDEHPATAKRFEITGNLIREWGGKVIEVQARGDTVAERLLTTTYLTDLVSVYLAVLRGWDPSPVPPISGLKASLEPLGVVKKAESQL